MIRSNVTAATRATVQRDVQHGFVAAGLDVQGNRYGYKLVADAPDTAHRDDAAHPGRRGRHGGPPTSARGPSCLHRFAGDKLAIQPGLRGERFGLTHEWVLDPRITLPSAGNRDGRLYPVDRSLSPTRAGDLDRLPAPRASRSARRVPGRPARGSTWCRRCSAVTSPRTRLARRSRISRRRGLGRDPVRIARQRGCRRCCSGQPPAHRGAIRGATATAPTAVAAAPMASRR